MNNIKNYILLLIILSSSIACSKAQIVNEQEVVFKEKIDSFLFSLYNKTSLDSISMVKKINEFIRNNEDTYVILREKDLQRYAKPPTSFVGYKVMDNNPANAAHLDSNINFLISQDVPNLNNIKATSLSEEINNYFWIKLFFLDTEGHNIWSSDNLSIESHFNVIRLYAQSINKDVWDITGLQLFSGLRFKWNIRTGAVSDFVVYKFEGKDEDRYKAPACYTQPVTNAANVLTQEYADYAWQHACKYVTDMYQGAERRTSKENFLTAHREDYVLVREKYLSMCLPASTINTSGYTAENSPLMGCISRLMLGPDNLTIAASGSCKIFTEKDIINSVVQASYTCLSENDSTYNYTLMGSKVILRSVYGAKYYTKRLKGNDWEVWEVSRASICKFNWNTRYDRVTGVQFWKENK